MSEQKEEDRVSWEASGAPIRPRRNRLGKLRRLFGGTGGAAALQSPQKFQPFQTSGQKWIRTLMWLMRLRFRNKDTRQRLLIYEN